MSYNFSNSNQCGSSLHNLLCGASSTECSRPPVRNERQATVIKITADKGQCLRGNAEMPSQFGGSLQSLRPLGLDMQTAGDDSVVQSKALRRRAQSGSPSTLCLQSVNQSIVEEECGAKSHFSSKVTVIEKKSKINSILKKDSSFTSSESESDVEHCDSLRPPTFDGADLKKSFEDFASALLNSQKRLYHLAEKIDESLNWSRKRCNSPKTHRVSQLRADHVKNVGGPSKSEVFASSPLKRPLLGENRGPLHKDENRRDSRVAPNQSFITTQIWSRSSVFKTPLNYSSFQFSTISSGEHKRLREVQKRFAQTVRDYIRVRIFLWDREMSTQDAQQKQHYGSCHFYVDQSRKLVERYHYLKQKMKRDFSASNVSERVVNKYVSKTNAVELKTVRLIKMLKERTGNSMYFYNNEMLSTFDENLGTLRTVTATKRKVGIVNYVRTSNAAEPLISRHLHAVGGNVPIRIPTLDLSGLTAPKDVCGNEAIENKNDEDGQQMDDGEVIGSAKTSEGISSIRELEIEGPIDRLEQRKESTDNTKDDSVTVPEEESIFTEEQLENCNNQNAGHDEIGCSGALATQIEECERADDGKGVPLDSQTNESSEDAVGTPTEEYERADGGEGMLFNDGINQTNGREEMSSDDAIGTPTDDYEKAAGGEGIQFYHLIMPENCKSRMDAKNTENDVSSIVTFEMPSENEPNVWLRHPDGHHPEASIQMDEGCALNDGNEHYVAEEDHNTAKVTPANIEKFDPPSKVETGNELYDTDGLLNQETVLDNLEGAVIQSTVMDDNCHAPNDSADFEETLTMSRLIEDDDNVDELDLDETLKPAQNMEEIVPEERDASERVGSDPGRPETDRVSSTSVVFSEITENFVGGDLEEVADVPNVTDGLTNHLKEGIEERVVIGSNESFAELNSRPKIGENSVDRKGETQFESIENDSFSNSLEFWPITSNIYDAVIVFNGESPLKNFSKNLDPSESSKEKLTEGAKSLNSGSVTVHNILLAPKDDKVNPPEPTASSPTPTISKLPMSSHLDSSISDNVENVESGEADDNRNVPIDGSTKGSNKNGGTHSDSLTEKENESISEELPFSPSQSVGNGSFSMSSSLLLDSCTSLKQDELHKTPENLTNSLALKNKSAIKRYTAVTKSDEPRSPRTPRRIVERFNTKFPSPLPTPTRFDESADSAANMSLIHSQSSPKSTKNASFAGEFYNLSIDGGQLLDDLPNISSISQILELSRDSLNASFSNSLANEADLRSRHVATLKDGGSHATSVISPALENVEGPADLQNPSHSTAKTTLRRAIPQIRQWLDAIVDYAWENSLHNVEEILPKHHRESILGLVSRSATGFTDGMFGDENHLRSFQAFIVDWCVEALNDVKAEKIESKSDLKKALDEDLLKLVTDEFYETSQRYLLRQFCESTSHIALDPIRLLVCEEICAHGTEYKWLEVRETDFRTCNYIVNHS